jgi:hypothetical protein
VRHASHASEGGQLERKNSMAFEAISIEVEVLYGVALRLEKLAGQHDLVFEGLFRIAESVRSAAVLLAMVAAKLDS